MARLSSLAAMVMLFVATFPSAGISADEDRAKAAVDWSVTLNPQVTIDGGSSWQLEMLADALGRFSGAGLELPDLAVKFSDDSAECNGAIGYFTTRYTPWRISICNDKVTSVYLHEIAHVWTVANLDDNTRSEFTELRELPSWNDRSKDWNKRGFELAAAVIAKGLSDPGQYESGIEKKLLGFELLAGITAPRLAG